MSTRRVLLLPLVALCAASAAIALRPAALRSAAPVAPPTPIAQATPTAAPKASRDVFSVVASYPHDTAAFTEGLVWDKGGFYESTGMNGHSSLRRVAFPSGKVTKSVALAQQYFGEGLALAGDELVQLTWQNHVGFVYDRRTFAPRRSFPVPTDGWGLTFDGAQFVMSDGSDTLFFLDPHSFKTVRRLRVTWDGAPLTQLNELEAINGQIWANVWQSDLVVRIDPASGRVMSYLDLSNIFPRAQRGSADVLNGIAYDPATRRVFVTGKYWPKLYALKVDEK